MCNGTPPSTTTTTAAPPPTTPTTLPPVLTPTTQPPRPPDTQAAARRLFQLMNQERVARGLPAFTRRSDVDTIAVAHSKRMAADGNIWHNDDYFTAATKNAIQAALVGENVARNADVDDMHRRLMKSPDHRDNILNPRFTQVGVGVAVGANGALFGTENFLQPRVPQRTAVAPAAPAAPKPVAAAPAPAPASLEAVSLEGPAELGFPDMDMVGTDWPGPLPDRDGGRPDGFVLLTGLAVVALAGAVWRLRHGKVLHRASVSADISPRDTGVGRGRQLVHSLARRPRAVIGGLRRAGGGRRG